MDVRHHYAVSVTWQGDRGTGTSGYRDYGREHLVSAEGKPDIPGSADRVFHGDRDRWNPEEMLLAALAQCHMLSYLHVAARHGLVVVAYRDAATATLEVEPSGGGRITTVTLRPVVTVTESASVTLAQSLHEEAAELCFIAASVAFPVVHEPETTVSSRTL